MKALRPLVVLADGPVPVTTDPASLGPLLGGVEPDLLVGWSPGAQPWLDAFLARPDRAGGPRLRTVMGGYALQAALAAGRGEYVPVRLSGMERLLARIRPSLAVIPAVPRGVGFALRGSIGWQMSAVRHADGLVLEVDAGARDTGLPEIAGHIVEVREVSAAADVYAGASISDAEKAIGAAVVKLLPDHPTLQFGLGTIGAAILSAIDRPVKIASGLASASVAELAGQGLLDGQATASYDWGGEATAQLVAEGCLRLLPVEECHDAARMAEVDEFVALNTALQVGLDGAVNVERLNGRMVAGIGGHADFCAGATRSRGGMSIIALRATARGGVSTIVPQAEVVSTARTEIDVVVTEFGTADLRGCDNRDRARRLVSIAAPEHRQALAASAGL